MSVDLDMLRCLSEIAKRAAEHEVWAEYANV